MSINFIQSKNGKIETQDINVSITKITPTPAAAERFSKIAVIATKPTTNGEDADGVFVTFGQDTKKLIHEQSEVKDFVGGFYLWNTENANLQDKIEAIRGKVKTVLLLSGRSESADRDLKWDDLTVFATETQSPTTMDDFVKNKYRGAFLDANKEGIALYVLSKMLEISRSVKNPITITTTGYSGIVEKATAEQLDDAGYSYAFTATNGSFARGVWVGTQQAYAIFNDFIVEYDVKEAINQYIMGGSNIDDKSIGQIETGVLATLSNSQANGQIREIVSISFPRLESLSSEQIRKGIITGIVVTYKFINALRTVHITMRGEN